MHPIREDSGFSPDMKQLSKNDESIHSFTAAYLETEPDGFMSVVS
jgi:hypothetical protein